MGPTVRSQVSDMYRRVAAKTGLRSRALVQGGSDGRRQSSLTLEGIRAAWSKGILVEYQCLPDTVDPRGPKGE